MIPRRPLGATGVEVPALGFGVAGPHASGLVPRAATIRLIRQAAEGGATLFDTAPFYGDGEAERRLGDALAELEGEAFVCSKAGTVRDGARVRKDFSPAHLAASVEASLARLRLPRLDLLLLHGPAPEHLTDETLDALAALKRDGRIALAGVCGRGAELDAAIRSGAFDAIMLPVHPGAADSAARWTAAARDAGLGVLGIETMAGGAGGAEALRAPRSGADLWYLARALRRRARGRRGGAKAAPEPRAPGPAAGLEWALAERRCDCAVISTTRPAHLAANLALAAGR